MKYIVATLALVTAVSSLTFVQEITRTEIVCPTNTYYEVSTGATGYGEAKLKKSITEATPWLLDVTVTNVDSAEQVLTEKDVNMCAKYDSGTWDDLVSLIFRQMLFSSNFADKPEECPLEAPKSWIISDTSNAVFQLKSNEVSGLYEVVFTAKANLTGETTLDPVTFTFIASENESGTSGPTNGDKREKRRVRDPNYDIMNAILLPFIQT